MSVFARALEIVVLVLIAWPASLAAATAREASAEACAAAEQLIKRAS